MYDRCSECGLVYQRNHGDTWLFWIIGDRIPIGLGIVALYFGFRPKTVIGFVLFFAAGWPSEESLSVHAADTIFAVRQAPVLSAARQGNDMLRRVLLILSVVGLVGSLGLWGISYLNIG